MTTDNGNGEQQTETPEPESQQVTTGTGVTTTVTGRPGGEPEWKTAIAEMQKTLNDLIAEKGEQASTKGKAKERVDELADQIGELTSALDEAKKGQRQAELFQMAAQADAIDPAIVVPHLSAADDPQAVLEGMKTSHAFLFKGKGRAASADMTGGGTSPRTGQGAETEMGKYIEGMVHGTVSG